MSKEKQLISVSSAAKLLEMTTENVRGLAKAGVITGIRIDRGTHTTTYYYKTEILARKNAAKKYISITGSTRDILHEAKELDKKAKQLRKSLKTELEMLNKHSLNIRLLSKASANAITALSAMGEERNEMMFNLAKDILCLTPIDEIMKKYGSVSEISIRNWSNKAIQSFKKVPKIIEENSSLREENEKLCKENESLKALIRKNEEAQKEYQTLHEQDLGLKEKETREKLLTPIGALNLSNRVYNCCHAYGIKTLGDIVGLGRESFRVLKNLGRKSLSELDAVLEKNNLDWRMDIRKYGLAIPESLGLQDEDDGEEDSINRVTTNYRQSAPENKAEKKRGSHAKFRGHAIN